MTDDDRTISRAELERLAAEASNPVAAQLIIAGREPIDVAGPMIIGREPSVTPGVTPVVISGDPLVSKSHVRLEVAGRVLAATDLGSSNGTSVETDEGAVELVEGTPTTVVDRARLLVGDTIVTVALQGSAEVPPPTPTSTVAPAPPSEQPVPGVISAVPPAAASGPGPIQPPQTTSTPPVPTPAAAGPPPASSLVVATCVGCGRVLVPGSRFCDGCGQPASAQQVPTAAAMTAASEPSGSGSSASGSSRRRNLIIAGAVAAAAAVVVAAGVVLLGGDDGASAGGVGEERLPEAVDRQWSEDVDGASGVAADGSRVYVMAVDDGDSELSALDQGDGSEVWQADFGRDQSYAYVLGVFDGVLIAETCDVDGACTTGGFDPSNGDELWDEDSDDEYFRPVDGALLWGDNKRLEVFDPKTGDTGERVHSDSLMATPQYVYAHDDDEIEVYDAATLESRFGPVEIDDEAMDWVFDGSNLVVAVDDELVFLDKEGKEARVSRVGDPIGRVESGPGGLLLVSTDDEVIAVKPTDGRAEEVWSERGSITRVAATDSGLLVGVSDDDDFDVLDARNGDVKVSTRGYYDNDHYFHSNGLIEEPYEEDDDVIAYDYETGDELWSDEFEGEVWVVDGAIVSVSSDGEVTLYR